MEYFFGKNIIITGGLGFIGSNLAKHLVNLGANVFIVDSLIPEYGGNPYNVFEIKNKVSINISDVRDSHSMRYLVQNKEIMFNLAGQTSHMDSMTDPYTDLDINCKAQLSILEACRFFNPSIKIVFASTRQVYGKPKYLPVDENHPLNPVDINGVNKLAGEWYHLLYNKIYQLNSCVLRLTNTYGPGMRIKDSRQTFLGHWIKSIVEVNPFPVWGGEQIRDFTYVDDVVQALLLTAMDDKTNGRVFNLGGDCCLSLNQLAQILSDLSGVEHIMLPFPEERKKIDIGSYYADFSCISAELDWFPRMALRDGLATTIDFYKQNINHYL